MCQNLSNAWNKIHFETSAPACSYSPLLPIGKEPPSSSAWSLPLFLPRFVSPQFIAWVPGLFVEGLCRSWLRDLQVTVVSQLKMTEEDLLSWLSRRVSFLAKAKSSYGLAFTRWKKQLGWVGDGGSSLNSILNLPFRLSACLFPTRLPKGLSAASSLRAGQHHHPALCASRRVAEPQVLWLQEGW